MRKAWFGAFLVLAVVLSISYAGLRWVKASDDNICAVCKRPVHAHSRTVALVDGRKQVYCCPTCALSEHHQDGRQVRVTELTDYATGAKLPPAQAWIVRGSDVNPCIRREGLLDADKRMAPIEFDRCAPGLLAFARREDAAAFMAQHGGRLVPFEELAPAFAR